MQQHHKNNSDRRRKWLLHSSIGGGDDSTRRSSAPSLAPRSAQLADEIRQAFREEQTDGILKLSVKMDSLVAPNGGDNDNNNNNNNNNINNIGVDDIVSAALEAANGNSGHVASIMNGFLGACSLMRDKPTAASRARDLLEAYDKLEQDRGINPDIVSYSLAYNALRQDDSDATGMADQVLQRAAKMSKKLSGSKRRKALAAARRKKPAESCALIENELKELLGNDFQVLQETDDYLVINKPSGVSCFHKKRTTSGKISKKKRAKANNNKSSTPPADTQHQQLSTLDVSLEDSLLSHNVPLSKLNPEALGLVHRLDRGTSGCMVLAKTDEMHAKFVSEFFLRRTKKLYTTIVAPVPPNSALSNNNNNNKDDAGGFVDLPVDGRPAKSLYKIVERYGTTAAMLQFEILTGRKHQVRVHAAKGLSSPVLMDGLYTSNSNNSSSNQNAPTALPDDLRQQLADVDDDDDDRNGRSKKLFLHASRLSIPEYGIDSEAPIPSWWEPVMVSLRRQR